MKCILLCAGYDQKNDPLKFNIDGQPIVGYVLKQIEGISEIDEIYLVTNNTYYNSFEQFLQNLDYSKTVSLINDKVNQPEDALGAIGDIMYTINVKEIDDDVMIIAGNNMFDFSLKPIVNYFKDKHTPVVCSSTIADYQRLQKFAVAQIDDNNRIIDLIEKPMYPDSDIGVYAIYIYPKEVLKQFDYYLMEGNKPDAPGYFVQYLYKKTPVYAYNVDGNYLISDDIENIDKTKIKK